MFCCCERLNHRVEKLRKSRVPGPKGWCPPALELDGKLQKVCASAMAGVEERGRAGVPAERPHWSGAAVARSQMEKQLVGNSSDLGT
jgi:hypothetical protein